MEGKGGEVRRLHIIYFLSHKGHIEQPHLIRVHHLARNGVYLRDVKRWLADLRGKDMPEAFSWSYKRRYKTGHVWQDLLDDDLITPISDNEYILKGSEVIPALSDSRPYSLEPKQICVVKEQSFEEEQQHSSSHKFAFQRYSDPTKLDSPSKSEEESPPSGSERSAITDKHDSEKLQEEKCLETSKQKAHEQEQSHQKSKSHSSFYSNLFNKKNKKKTMNEDWSEKAARPTSSISYLSSSHDNGASNRLRNWIICGVVETEDRVTAITKQAGKDQSNELTSKSNNPAEICQQQKLNEYATAFRTWEQQQQIYSARKSSDAVMDTRMKKQNELENQKTVPQKPLGWPNCSQCGKSFIPEKMHAHMNSCRGIKNLARD